MTIPSETRPSETHVGDAHVSEVQGSFVSYTKTSFRSGHIVVPGSQERFVWSKPVDPKRLRQLEQENAKLRKLLAARDLEIEVIRGSRRVRGSLTVENAPEAETARIPGSARRLGVG